MPVNVGASGLGLDEGLQDVNGLAGSRLDVDFDNDGYEDDRSSPGTESDLEKFRSSVMPVNRSRPPTTSLFPYSLEQLSDPETYRDVLTRVGTSELSDTTRVSTWSDAMRICNDEATSRVLVESMNQVGAKVQQVDYNLYNLWNIFANHSKPRLPELADKFIRPRVPAGMDAKIVIDQINWIVIGATIERCYAIVGIVEPMWATRWCQMIVDGYLPCGWEGEFPSGRTIVF